MRSRSFFVLGAARALLVCTAGLASLAACDDGSEGGTDVAGSGGETANGASDVLDSEAAQAETSVETTSSSDTTTQVGDTGEATDTPEVTPPTVGCERRIIEIASGAVVSRETDELDALGRVARTLLFEGAALEPHAVIASSYDAQGRRVLRTVDEGMDGAYEATQTWTYDAQGRVVEATDDRPIWGYRITREFDEASGALRTKRRYEPGEPEPRVVVEYTIEDGRPVAGREMDLRVLPSLSVEHYAYDVRGRLVETSTDYEDDGTIDRIWTFDFDANGRMRELGDRSGDGFWVEGTTLLFDTEGRVFRAVWDSTLDGIEQTDFRYHSKEDGGGLAEAEFYYPRLGPATARSTWSPSCRARAGWQDFVPSVEIEL